MHPIQFNQFSLIKENKEMRYNFQMHNEQWKHKLAFVHLTSAMLTKLSAPQCLIRPLLAALESENVQGWEWFDNLEWKPNLMNKSSHAHTKEYPRTGISQSTEKDRPSPVCMLLGRQDVLPWMGQVAAVLCSRRAASKSVFGNPLRVSRKKKRKPLESWDHNE